jgi:beta-glucosidase
MIPATLIALSGALLVSGQSTASWSTAYSKANTALAKLSSAQKISIVSGIGWDKGPCVGNTAAISTIGYPQLCLQDGPLGVRYGNGVTAFTPGIQAASTWDRELIQERGQFMA